MKRSVHTYRMLVITALILLGTGIKKLDAGFHIRYLKKEAPKCVAVKKSFLPDDNFVVKVFLRFASLDEKMQPLF